jgi:hypothetical protein
MEFHKYKVEVKRLAKLSKVIKGSFVADSELKDVGDYPYLNPDHIKPTGIYFDNDTRFVSFDFIDEDKTLTSPGDILVAVTLDGLKWCLLSEADTRSFPGEGVVLIRPKSPSYINTYLSSDQGKQVLNDIESRWNSSKQFTSYLFDQLNKLRVPLIHVDNLHDLSDPSISGSDEETLKRLFTELKDVKVIFETIENDRIAKKSEYVNTSSKFLFQRLIYR